MGNNLDITEIKEVAANILYEFDKVCIENGIVYSITSGTLLGAVRHNGFIPWDDDIDVVMLRDEYNKLLNVIDKNNPFDENIILYDVSLTPKYSLPLAKLVDMRTVLHQTKHVERIELGVYVDIFILDRVPIDEQARRSLYSKASVLQYLWSISDAKAKKPISVNPKQLLKYLITKVLNSGFSRIFAKQIQRLAVKSNLQNKKSNYVGNLLYTDLEREKNTLHAREMLDVERVVFEGYEVYAIKSYDSFLKNHYNGDYMTLPPEKDRVSHHTYEAYWR